MSQIWVEVVFAPPYDESVSFIARVDEDLETAVFTRPETDFIRFDYVRWLDEEGEPLPNERDDGFGTDHYFFLRKALIFRVEPIRGEYVSRWDATLPDYAS